MRYDVVHELHEATVHVRLVDEAPTVKTLTLKSFIPGVLTAYWVKENAGAWELVTVTLTGEGQSRTLFPVASKLPEWIADLVENITPPHIRQENSL
jgi:hypothetical protein